MKIPASHPRAKSLKAREKIIEGIKMGMTSQVGLIAHGRGEAFDYLLREKTHPFAQKAITAAAAYLLTAKHPVISVNGNVAALVGRELARFSNRWSIPLEVNIFYYSKVREQKLIRYLKKCWAKKVLGSSNKPHEKLKGIAHARAKMDRKGIAKADVVFIPLEDGDRCQALIRAGKKVITVDLNPISRTAKKSTITIVDELSRTLPLLHKTLLRLSKESQTKLNRIRFSYSNRSALKEAEKAIRNASF